MESTTVYETKTVLKEYQVYLTNDRNGYVTLNINDMVVIGVDFAKGKIKSIGCISNELLQTFPDYDGPTRSIIVQQGR